MRVTLLSVLLLIAPATVAAATAEPKAPGAASAERVSLLTAEQLLQILDETVDWYRTLGTQRQSATQPSDLLLFYANHQIADKVIGLAFQVARANAELLSSEVSAAPTVTTIVDEHRGEIVRQAEAIRRTTSSDAAADVAPQVQLQFSASGVEAKVRYPVPLDRAAEVDERVSQQLHQAVR
jgi:hypothetical protein